MSKLRVGDIRPSQFMFTYGIGALIDLPGFSAIVNGLDDWQIDQNTRRIHEDRLLRAVKYFEPHAKQLITPPLNADEESEYDEDGNLNITGLSVSVFPTWMICPLCNKMFRVGDSQLELKIDYVHLDRIRYVHVNCEEKKGSGAGPQVLPVRFMAACENGHLEDFPWVEFVHEGKEICCENPKLGMIEYGLSGEARGVIVKCFSCRENTTRLLSEAFQKDKRDKLPQCTGFRPHLRDHDPDPCEHKIRPIILGASNTWFPVSQNVIAIPVEQTTLNQLIDENWVELIDVEQITDLDFLRRKGRLPNQFNNYSDEEVLKGINLKKDKNAEVVTELPDLRRPEWDVFTGKTKLVESKEFKVKSTQVPGDLTPFIHKILLVERLREVSALIGFTRIDSFGEYIDPDLEMKIPRVPLYRNRNDSFPANEVRGEGIFIQLKEAAIQDWERRNAVQKRDLEFFESHKNWRKAHFIENPESGFPGIRYVLLHSLSHAIMRQLALSCGYPTSSIRERIYSDLVDSEKGPMAGILLYTAAPDSDGTLGGLVEQGKMQQFGYLMRSIFQDLILCANDPTCAENTPNLTGQTIHGAACHACLFSPETACERGNKYLDRSLIVNTIEHADLNFFGL